MPIRLQASLAPAPPNPAEGAEQGEGPKAHLLRTQGLAGLRMGGTMGVESGHSNLFKTSAKRCEDPSQEVKGTTKRCGDSNQEV